jgi:peptidoglycan hydrolase-like protein with peptidoglycan-binding domain
MEGRQQRDPGYDDWFDEPEPPTQGSNRAARGISDGGDEVWVLPEEPERGGGGRREIVIGGWALTTTQAAILAAALLAVIFAILAAFGVFSGGNGNPAGARLTTPTNPPPTVSASVTTPTVTAHSAKAPTSQLKPGDTGTQVKTLQKALNALGYSSGKPDGFYGPATKDAVEKFQQKQKLDVDGVVGPNTLTALQQALSG